MPDTSQFNMDFRPKSYWVYDSPKKKIKATVKGEVRRSVAECCLEEPDMMGIDACAFDESLADAERARRASMHPMFMGGEFLPDKQQGEVEIARVAMKSVTYDVISVYARWEKGKIHYRVVDEYFDENGPYPIRIESSDQPLTLAELIELMDTATYLFDDCYEGIVMGPILSNYNIYPSLDALNDMAGFITVDSAFYPELGHWYDEVIREWYDETAEELRMEEEEERLDELARIERQKESGRGNLV